MGVAQSFASLFQPLWGPQEQRILCLGLDSSGKTTLLCKLRLGQVLTEIPVGSLGHHIETLTYNHIKFTSWDLGGRDPSRFIWRQFYPRTSGIIFMVDCNDRDRIGDADRELQHLLQQEDLRGVPLLVFANKMDLPNAMKREEVVKELRLTNIHDREWHAQMCCAVESEGLLEGLQWLEKALSARDGSASAPPPPPQPVVGVTKA